MPISFEEMRMTLDRAAQDDEARKPSHVMFEMLADWVEAIVWVGNGSGDLLYVNRYWRDLTGLGLEETGRTGWQAVVHPDDVEEMLRQREAQFRNGTPFYARYRVRDFRTGQYYWFRGKSVRFVEGKKVMWFGMSIPDGEEGHEHF